ncbi:hypothetical protein BT96DRAFT_945952 [Gymnopus androsaceus JB14]|uniref:Uncharacterized protein n=1 Tax=Gymnopus androsaceus JB14 TaxID=1447944 RepID=A0A6A4GXS2_9AGAR|nr:hypothetical protein BT96DRAFT_945952 [Gymnopus androsaceus JB14]
MPPTIFYPGLALLQIQLMSVPGFTTFGMAQPSHSITECRRTCLEGTLDSQEYFMIEMIHGWTRPLDKGQYFNEQYQSLHCGATADTHTNAHHPCNYSPFQHYSHSDNGSLFNSNNSHQPFLIPLYEDLSTWVEIKLGQLVKIAEELLFLLNYLVITMDRIGSASGILFCKGENEDNAVRPQKPTINMECRQTSNHVANSSKKDEDLADLIQITKLWIVDIF